MASIFTPCEGGVFRVPLEDGGCHSKDVIIALSVDGFDATVPVTGVSIDLGTNHQFLHTLDEFIYVYSFGDRIGQMTISGISFTECSTTAGGSPINVYNYYMKNRLAKTLKPTKLQLAGSTVALGFLTGLKMEIPNPTYPIMQWALQFNVILNTPDGGVQPPATTYSTPPNRYTGYTGGRQQV
jgi:hypothetical protein